MAPLGPWAPDRRVAVAVSGGADSLCLAYLAASWGYPLALVVDHGLRGESAAEAQITASRLQNLAIPHVVLTLSGVAPAAAEARAARYAALIAAAKAAGLTDLLLGHHSLDQAETVLMRRRAGSGPAGLAGMAAITHGADIRFVRPLLNVHPTQLRAILRAAGLQWVEDPSNQNPAYLRSRLRQELAASSGNDALHRQAVRAAASRTANDAAVAAELAERVCVFPEGFARLSPGALSAQALGALLRTIGGAPHMAPAASLGRLAAAPGPAVLGGVRLLRAGRVGAGWLVVREAAAMAPPQPAADGALWDRRFHLSLPTPLPGATFGAVGRDAPALRARSTLPAAVLCTLPAFRVNGVLAAVPHIGYRDGSVVNRVTMSFIPAHPLAGAPFDACDAVWEAGVLEAGVCEEGGCGADSKPPC